MDVTRDVTRDVTGDAIVVLAGQSLDGFAACLACRLAAAGCPLIAADGGADRLAELGLSPDLIVGDGDSLAGDFSSTPRLDLERRKNFTDGEAALAYALAHYPGRVWLLGALGGRPDHQLANLLLPLHAARDRALRRVWLAGDNWRACYAGAGRTQIKGQAGDLVSIIPLQPLSGLSLSGLEYPLEHYQAGLGDSRTVSNVLSGSEGEIFIEQGVALVFQIFLAPTPDYHSYF